ncbi:MAG: hypothetical protein ACREXY_04540 [Gammaproteobacteria bacterium]
MQQVTLAFENENDEPADHGPPIAAERERQLVELMAQAIVAVLQHRDGEEHESA